MKRSLVYIVMSVLSIFALVLFFRVMILPNRTAGGELKGYAYNNENGEPNIPISTRPIPEAGNTVLPSIASHEKKDWTLMVYMTADSNLDQAGLDDLNEMEMAGSSPTVNIVALLDRQGQDNTSLYFVTQDKVGSPTIVSQLVVDNPYSSELNMGDPKNLVTFVDWTTRNYPAEHYLLVLWGHGLGWRGIGFDENNSNDQITPVELNLALKKMKNESGISLDIVAFDACLMQMVEFASAIGESGSSSYIIGSQESVPGPGWNYKKVISIIELYSEEGPKSIAENITKLYLELYPGEKVTLSALQSSSINELSAQVDALADSLVLSRDWAEISKARSLTEQFNEPSYVDFFDLAAKIRSVVPDSNVQKTVERLPGSIPRIIVCSRNNSTHPYAKGISIYFPSGGDVDGNYSRNTLNTSKWKNFLTKYLEASRKTTPVK
jgi:hypothetical protein